MPILFISSFTLLLVISIHTLAMLTPLVEFNVNRFDVFLFKEQEGNRISHALPLEDDTRHVHATNPVDTPRREGAESVCSCTTIPSSSQ